MTTFEYLTHLKAQRGIDCFGMSADQQARMLEVGYDRWLDEYEVKAPVRVFSVIPCRPKERPIRRCLCVRCGEVFLSHTRAAKKCPDCGGVNDILQKNGKQLRACASGMECLKAGKCTPAEAAPGKQYCSENCHGSHRARLERQNGCIGS